MSEQEFYESVGPSVYSVVIDSVSMSVCVTLCPDRNGFCSLMVGRTVRYTELLKVEKELGKR